MRRCRALLLAGLLVALSLALPASAAARSCGRGGTYEEAGNGWLALRPEFRVGGAEVTAIATPVFRPDTIYATNGRVVMRTEDGGCNWTTVLDIVERVLDVADSPFDLRVVALGAPSSATSTTHVYVAIERTFLDAPPRPAVLSSGDAGQTWVTAQTGPDGLPALGRIRELAVCNLVPKAAYVVVDVPNAGGPPTTALYQTSDAGLTWTRRTPTPGAFDLRGLVVNPQVASVVYAYAPGGLRSSDTSGEAFSELGPQQPVSDISAAVGLSYIRLAVGHPNTDYVSLSDDGGESWRMVPSPITPAHVAVAPLRDLVAVSDYAKVAVVGAGRIPVDVTPDVGEFGGLRFAAPTPAGTALAAIGDGAVLRAVLDLQTSEPIPSDRPIRLLPQVFPNYFSPVMVPPRTTVSLPAGGTREVPFTLLLPRTPSPIDVMFLVDSTGSMQPVIDGLKQSMAEIVNELAAVGLDVRFGVGDFRDVPQPHGKAPLGDHPYRRFREIGPADKELQDAISQITADGGRGITSALIAAHQATTGSGWRATDGALVVDPGQDAEWRPKSLRLLVLATDIGMAQDGNYPTMAAAAKTLTEHDVRALGLAIAREARAHQGELASLTGAVAPPGGLDCDGDGRNDLRSGDPLVCDAPMDRVGGGLVGGPPVRLGPAVVALTERVTDFRPVRVTIDGDAGYATVTQGGVHPAVNLKADNELPFAVRFACPMLPKPSVHEFVIAAGPADVPGASATALLECGPAAQGKPKRPRPTVPEELYVLPGAAPVAAAAAPGPPPPPNPIPNANPNLNPNPGANANVAGIVNQRQEQYQVALAENDEQLSAQLQEGGGQQLAMSARREADPALLLGPAALLVASATWVAHRRTGARAAPARAGPARSGPRGRRRRW